MSKDSELYGRLRAQLITGLSVLTLYSFLLTALLICGAYRLVKVGEQIHDHSNTIQHLQKNCLGAANERKAALEEKAGIVKDRREVLSSAKVTLEDMKSMLRGPAGPPGMPGKDGRDASSIAAIEKTIDTSVKQMAQREWTKLSSNIPNYGGATYVRWGRKSCPEKSKMVYTGVAGGPGYVTPGGGTNLQCLPSDPEYDPHYAGIKVIHGLIGSVIYENYDAQSMFGPNVFRQRVPCTVCEATQRLTKLMIPGKVRCPSSDWTLEYKGVLVSQNTNDGHGAVWTHPSRFRQTYECLDAKSEAADKKGAGPFDGTLLYLNAASCDGSAKLVNCPPYQSNKVLSCVVCTK